jgi:hypothetical protein
MGASARRLDVACRARAARTSSAEALSSRHMEYLPLRRLFVLTVISAAGLAYAGIELFVSGLVPRSWIGIGVASTCQIQALFLWLRAYLASRTDRLAADGIRDGRAIG